MNARAQTKHFRYQAWLRGVRNILRYESAHAHRSYAHKHVYDTFGDGLESAVIELRDEDQIPTLGEVIRELQVWHGEHASRIRELK